MKTLALALIAASSALAGTTDERIPDAAYLTYAEGFRPFAQPLRVVEASGKRANSTAVLIGDHWAITATTPAQITMISTGKTQADETVAKFFVTWSFKRKS